MESMQNVCMKMIRLRMAANRREEQATSANIQAIKWGIFVGLVIIITIIGQKLNMMSTKAETPIMYLD